MIRTARITAISLYWDKLEVLFKMQKGIEMDDSDDKRLKNKKKKKKEDGAKSTKYAKISIISANLTERLREYRSEYASYLEGQKGMNKLFDSKQNKQSTAPIFKLLPPSAIMFAMIEQSLK